MSSRQIAALQGLTLAVLTALVSSGVIDANLSKTLTGVLAAFFTAVAAFFVTAHKDF